MIHKGDFYLTFKKLNGKGEKSKEFKNAEKHLFYWNWMCLCKDFIYDVKEIFLKRA